MTPSHQNTTTQANRDLGSDAELAELVERVRGFDYHNATPTDQVQLAKALHVLALDIVRRYEAVRELEKELQNKTSLAEVTTEIAAVLRVLDPPKSSKSKPWFGW